MEKNNAKNTFSRSWCNRQGCFHCWRCVEAFEVHQHTPLAARFTTQFFYFFVLKAFLSSFMLFFEYLCSYSDFKVEFRLRDVFFLSSPSSSIIFAFFGSDCVCSLARLSHTCGVASALDSNRFLRFSASLRAMLWWALSCSKLIASLSSAKHAKDSFEHAKALRRCRRVRLRFSGISDRQQTFWIFCALIL